MARIVKLFTVVIKTILPRVSAGKSCRGGRLSTVDLLALTSLDKRLFQLKFLFIFLTKRAVLTILSLHLQLVFRGFGHY